MSGKAADTTSSRRCERATLWVAPRFRSLFARNGLCELDDLFAVEGVARFEKKRLASWRERIAFDLTDEDGMALRFYLKRFTDPPASVQWKRRLTGQGMLSFAGIERRWIELLRADGIPVPEVAAFGEEMNGSRERRSALVLAEVPGESLERWCASRREAAPRVLVQAVALLVARLHGAGYIHRDMYLSHVFADGRESASPVLTLIDLQRVLAKPLRWSRWVARDLAQLDYSTPQAVANTRARLRFLKAYLGDRKLATRESRRLIRRVVAKSNAIARHDAKRLKAGGN